ncbi:MAG: hypothetical protein LBV26_03205, partial [Bacteroidales bacterium]|nr:hypothetical protein [Bacteroidales bacterium]
VISGEYTALRDQFNFFCIQTGKFKYDNERFVDVTPEELDKAFVEWLNAKTGVPNKQEILDHLNRMKEERARRRAAAGN